MLFTGHDGRRAGNLDPVLNTPFAVILAMSAILCLLAVKKYGETREMKTGHRIWIWFLSFICLGALMFSMLLGWTPVSATKIQGVQGRYLLPLLPMLLLTMKSSGWCARRGMTGCSLWADGHGCICHSADICRGVPACKYCQLGKYVVELPDGAERGIGSRLRCSELQRIFLRKEAD